MTFDELNLNKPLFKALEDMGMTHPTSIQAKAIPVVMSGKDVIGIAQTGTGKTLAYLLPCLRLWKFTKHRFPEVLIIVPTRELVAQVVEEVEKLSTYSNVVVGGVYGGHNMNNHRILVENGLDVLVATPGRLMALATEGTLRLKHIKRLIIDEVDEMLNLGFRPQLTRILDMLPEKRQNLMFSATMTKEVDDLLKTFFNFPVTIEAAPTGTPLENIEQSGYHLPNFNTKVNFLALLLEEQEDMTKVLIFTATKKMADLLYEKMEEKHPEQVGLIHSNKAQNNRFKNLRNFHDGTFRMLIATDIVARGLDISEVSHVINFEMPDVAENYMHRIGRTGRANKSGIAISFITEKEQEFQKNAEALMKQPINIKENPEHLEISEELIPSEMPQIHMRNTLAKEPKIKESQGAFHEKKHKDKIENRGIAKRRWGQLKKKKGGGKRKKRKKK